MNVSKRYILFMWFGAPLGGWNDFFSSFDKVDNAVLTISQYNPVGWQIVDSLYGKVEAEYSRDGGRN